MITAAAYVGAEPGAFTATAAHLPRHMGAESNRKWTIPMAQRLEEGDPCPRRPGALHGSPAQPGTLDGACLCSCRTSWVVMPSPAMPQSPPVTSSTITHVTGRRPALTFDVHLAQRSGQDEDQVGPHHLAVDMADLVDHVPGPDPVHPGDQKADQLPPSALARSRRRTGVATAQTQEVGRGGGAPVLRPEVRSPQAVPPTRRPQGAGSPGARPGASAAACASSVPAPRRSAAS